MILKFRTGIKENWGWKIIGNIKEIDYKYIDEPKKYDVIDYYLCTSPDLKDKKITKITIILEDEEYKTIYTDDIVYIINENGKTCESVIRAY